MKLTKFTKLRKAIESLDAHLIRNKIGALEKALQNQGMPVDPKNTAITHEGIFYIEPESGIATKVIIYVGDFPTYLTPAQQSNLASEGYADKSSIEKFHPYHLMSCNTLTAVEREGWKQNWLMTKRTDDTFFYRIVSEHTEEGAEPEVYQKIDRQKLHICSYCFWKVTSILVGAQGSSRDEFHVKSFFDVNMIHSWNSHGELSKDYGFTQDMYPEDWLEISRIRQAQTQFTCESCFEDLSPQQLRRFLFVNPTDHVEGQEGYVKLECLCIRCLAETPSYKTQEERPELQEYLRIRERNRELEEEQASHPPRNGNFVDVRR